jgi:hypothetical protein
MQLRRNSSVSPLIGDFLQSADRQCDRILTQSSTRLGMPSLSALLLALGHFRLGAAPML